MKQLSKNIAVVFFLASMRLFAAEPDTITLQKNQRLILSDTIYFGINDSLVIIENGIKFKIKREHPKAQKVLYDRYKGKASQPSHEEKVAKEGEMMETRLYFEPYDGKIIRKIYFKQVELLEGNVLDTANTSISGFGKFLSSAHVHTKPRVIKNNLRFNENDVLNAEILAENERLLRGLPYIEDAKIYIQEDSRQSDSVDVYVVTKDNFPIGISFNYMKIDRFIVDLFTNNINGMGHESGVQLEYHGDSTSSFGFGFRYTIENVSGSFARTSFEYLNLTGIKQVRLNLTRPFLTNDVIFGGELNFAQTETVRIWRQYDKDTSYLRRELFKANTYDVWLGKSFFLAKNVYDKFINAGVRYFRDDYMDRPYVEADTNHLFHDHQTFLANVTFKNMNYFKTAKLLGYGVPEDVPVGLVVQLTGGFRKYEFSARPLYWFFCRMDK